MSSFGWADAASQTPAVRTAVEALQQAFQQILGDNLLGVYLHGSLALGCFNPAHSDLDLLVCIGEAMTADQKRVIAQTLLDMSAHPYPIEISFVRQQDIHPWQFPTPFEFHYSEEWRPRYEVAMSNDSSAVWNQHALGGDIDLAAHITITRARGITLFGPPATQIFPPVPPSDYLAAILDDTNFARDHIVEHPIYGVLNLCRVYAYVREGHIFSKDEGGTWASGILPPPFQAIVDTVLAAYRSGQWDGELATPEELRAFAAYMDTLIQGAVADMARDREI